MSKRLTGLNWAVVGPAIILVAGLALMLTSPFGFRTETQTVSLQVASFALSEENSPHVVLVDIDQASLEEIGPWPWPRTQIARLVQAVHETGASTILLNLSLEGQDLAAPQRAVEAWGLTGEEARAASALALLPDTDQVLLEVLADTGAILLVSGSQTDEAIDGLPPLMPMAPVAFNQDHGGTFLPLANLQGGSGLSTVVPTRMPLGLRRDFIGRPSGIFPVLSVNGIAFPTAALASLLSTSDDGVLVTSEGVPGTLGFIDPVGMTGIDVGEVSIPTLTDGTILLRRNLSAPAFSASTVLNGAAADQLQARTVVIGSSLEVVASGDDPLAPSISTAQALTAAIAQVMAGTSPTRPFVYTWIEVLIALFAGVVIIFLGARNRPWTAIIFSFGLTTVLFVIAGYLLSQSGTLLDASAVGFVLIFASALTMAGTEDSPQNIMERFGQTVEEKLPFGTPTKITRNPKALMTLAESRKITVLACTVRDFENLQDLYKDDPIGLTTILHQFHEMVSDTVRSYGGTADRYGGATMMAFWNAPLEEPDHALKACDCALRIIDALEQLNQVIEGQSHRMGKPYSPLHLGIGINTGRSVVGNVGSMKRPDYSAVGETVTVARSLLSASSHYGPAIIVGEHTYQAVKNRFALLEVDKMAVPHRAYAIRVFALLGNPVTKAAPRFRALEEAHASIFEAYRSQNWALAAALISECRKLNGAIPSLYDLYEQRIAYYRSFPPQAEWDGSFQIPVV